MQQEKQQEKENEQFPILNAKKITIVITKSVAPKFSYATIASKTHEEFKVEQIAKKREDEKGIIQQLPVMKEPLLQRQVHFTITGQTERKKLWTDEESSDDEEEEEEEPTQQLPQKKVFEKVLQKVYKEEYEEYEQVQELKDSWDDF